MPLSHFDERSGIVSVITPWGRWWQTIGEVFIEVNVPPGTKGKDCKVLMRSKTLECRVHNEEVFKGHLYSIIRTDDSTWTLEGRTKMLIMLVKAEKYEKENAWASLVNAQFEANPYIYQEMLKKLELEKYQTEHPGFDFIAADLSKTYENAPFMPGVSKD